MKKLVNSIALFILVSVNVLTPISYAQESEQISPTLETSPKSSPNREDLQDFQSFQEGQDSQESGENDISLIKEGDHEVVEDLPEVGESLPEIVEDLPEVVEDLPEVQEDKVPSLIDMVVNKVDELWTDKTEEFDENEAVMANTPIMEELDEWDWSLLQEDWDEELFLSDEEIEVLELDISDRQSNLPEDFEWWEITIYNQNNTGESITIMDRNLWATTNDITSADSYWYHYQWWNNYWFSAWCDAVDEYSSCEDTISENASDTKIEYNDSYNHKGYYWETFIISRSSPYWYWTDSATNSHGELWWGENDKEENNWWFDNIVETEENRQWPCPNWRHVPSAWERSKLLEYYMQLVNVDISDEDNSGFPYQNNWWYSEWLLNIANQYYNDQFLDYFKIPLAFTRDWYNANLYRNIVLWSSSPSSSANYYKYMYGWDYQIGINDNYGINANSIRCFKNVMNTSSDTQSVSISFYIDDEQILKQYVQVNWKTVRPKVLPEHDKMFGSRYLVRYTDKNYSQIYDFSTKVTWDMNLYWKWIESVKHENWLIKITDWDKTIYVKDRNQWATKTVVMDKKQRLDDLDHEMGMLAEQKWLGAWNWRSDDELVALAIQKAQDIVWNSYTISTLDDIYNFYNIYNPYEDADYTASFWDYYFRWNNNWIKFNQLNLSNCWYDGCSVDLSNLENVGWNLWNEETWWEEWSTNNPCDASAWEYLPTVDDWKEVMDLWATVSHDKQNEYTYKPVYKEGPDYYEYYFRQEWDDAVEHFRMDFMIPKAWYVYNDRFWFNPDLWTAIDYNDMVWYASEWYLQYSTKEDALSWFNESASPVRCFVSWTNISTIKFNLNWGEWNIEQQRVMYKIQEPETIPTKNWYTFVGRYTEDGDKWDFENDRVDGDMTLYAKRRVCGDGFRVEWNQCIPDNIEWVIIVSDWDDTMYIRDRNVWAELNLSGASELQNELCTWVEPVCNCSLDLSVSCCDATPYLSCSKEYYEKINWTYYFRWNNNGTNYTDLVIDENSGEITNMLELDEKFLEWWKLWTVAWSGWIEWNTNNPCNGEWEYLPTAEDWLDLINIWANKNWYDLSDNSGLVPYLPVDEVGSLGTFAIDSAWIFEFPNLGYANQFSQDMLIPYAWMIRYDYSSCYYEDEDSFNCDKMYYKSWIPFLWASHDKNWYVWIYNWDWVYYDTAENMVDDWINDAATPVRCFVNVPDVLVVTLESDGRVYKELNVVKWKTLNEPTAPSKSNATFDGWYTEDGEKYDFDTPFTEDVTLYAKWTENKWNGYSGGGSSSKPKTEPVDKQHNAPDEKKAELEIKKEEWKNIKIITDAPVNTEKETFNAHQWAYSKWLTKYRTSSEARMDDFLNRSEMAKISSIFATEFLDKTPNEKKKEFCSQYSDMRKVEDDMKFFITESCELWYMWYESNGIDALERFRPYTPLTVAETATILSRIVWWNENAMNGKDWYKWHLYATYNHGLIDDIKDPTTRSITRREAYTMLYRLVNMVE